MWSSEQKPAMFAYKLNFILLSQLIATLNNYIYRHVHCPHWLMSTGLFARVLLADHLNPWLVKWHQRRAPMWQRGSDKAPTVSAHLSILGLALEYWPFVGTCTCHSYSTLYHLYHLASLFKFLILLTPPSCPSCLSPYICWPSINEFHEKSPKTRENQPLSTCQVNCTKANS